jgi:universal stress protein A
MNKFISNKPHDYDDILLIPTDFSMTCRNAILQGMVIARELQYRVCILHVIDKQNQVILKEEKDGEDCIGLNFRNYVSQLGKEYNVPVETLVQKGNIVSVILRVAEEIRANLMILGTEGRHGLEYFFGSHALKLVL